MCIETTETKTLCCKRKNYSDAISSNFYYKNYVKENMKRLFDIVASGCGLLVLSPVLLIVAIWI